MTFADRRARVHVPGGRNGIPVLAPFGREDGVRRVPHAAGAHEVVDQALGGIVLIAAADGFIHGVRHSRSLFIERPRKVIGLTRFKIVGFRVGRWEPSLFERGTEERLHPHHIHILVPGVGAARAIPIEIVGPVNISLVRLGTRRAVDLPLVAIRGWVLSPVVGDIVREALPDGPQVDRAFHRVRRLPSLAQRRQQYADQQSDDSDHNQQLHQCERTAIRSMSVSHPRYLSSNCQRNGQNHATLLLRSVPSAMKLPVSSWASGEADDFIGKSAGLPSPCGVGGKSNGALLRGYLWGRNTG